MPVSSEKQKQYDKKYLSKNKKICLTFKLEMYKDIEAAASLCNKTVNNYLKEIILKSVYGGE